MLLCIGKTLLKLDLFTPEPPKLRAPEVLSYTGGTRLVPLYQKDSLNRRDVPKKDLCELTNVMPYCAGIIISIDEVRRKDHKWQQQLAN